MNRTSETTRQTKETQVNIKLDIDGKSHIDISTGIGFFDHMLSALAFHASWDLTLTCEGDLYIDDHHTVEDCGLALGTTFSQAIGDKTGIKRFGSRYAPLDEALARTVIDLSGRAGAFVNLNLQREQIGNVACENLTHFFHSFSATGLFTIHVDVLKGVNDHHKAEAAFKSTAISIREAVSLVSSRLPSTKGTL